MRIETSGATICQIYEYPCQLLFQQYWAPTHLLLRVKIPRIDPSFWRQSKIVSADKDYGGTKILLDLK